MCDLDPTKICDNCGKCIGLDHTDKSPEYRAIKVDGIIDETMDPNDYLYDEETLDDPQEEDDEFCEVYNRSHPAFCFEVF